MESSWSMLFSSHFALLLITLFATGVIKFVFVLYHVYTYWSKRGVPYIRSIPNVGMSWKLLFRRLNFPDYVMYIYNYDPDAKYIGLMDMTTPLVLIRDPELIKDVMVKDFEHFTDHIPFVSEQSDPLFGKNVLALRGDRWKEMRTTLSPSFTASKMKVMFELVSRYSHEFTKYLTDHPELWSSLYTEDAFKRYATDVIATSAFGISVSSMKDRNNEFFMRGEEALNFSSFVAILKFMLFRASPRLMKALGINFFSSATSKFFKRIVAESIKIREEQGIVRPDMIHLLMQARDKEGRSVHDMTLDDIVSQAFIFFLAGFGTSSTLMCFLVHELAVNRDIQDRLFEEIERHLAEGNGEISYELMLKMTYLDMVVSEALRKYPPVPMNDRICVKSYKLPPSKPGCKSVIIKPNSMIWIPAYALHNDPNYFPNPSKFDPERFSDENKDNIVPYTYMPFGFGPRMCIGTRFALMEVKLLVIHLLHKFIIKTTEKTVDPMVFDKTMFALHPDGGFWISLEKNSRGYDHNIIFNERRNHSFSDASVTMELSWSSLLSSPFALLLTTLFAIGVLKLVVVLYHVYTHWKKRGVPYIPAVPNLGSPWILLFRRMSFPDFNKHIYNYDPNAKYIGMMDIATPLVVLRDPELIKDVIVKDFEHFTDHPPFVTEEFDPLFGKNVFALCGDRWKEMRNTLSPSFTASKMKVMFELVSRCSHEFTEYLADHPELRSSIDTKDAFRRYATDVIATSAFGISVNSMKERSNEFFIRGMEASNFSSFVPVLKFMLFRTTPRLMKALGMHFFSSATSQFFKRIVAETIKIREEQGIVRPDMIHLLMQARDKEGRSSVHDMTLDDIVSQAFIFFLAGFDTSSTIMCFLVHELAVHRDIQDRLYEEIERHLAEGNGEISYELMSKMTYLDMVVSEALRKYPPVPIIDRICVKSYKLSPSKPGCKSVIIEPTSIIWIPAYALHHDPNYFPDPSKFDPERFSDENKDNIVPYTYMPFGLGPRMCIGNRFALMEVKLLVVHLLQKFIFKATEKTVDPIVFDKSLFALHPDGGFWISLEKREK
ncbi:PREDICTED: uncharacterized protein LOC106751726 [Dinoponera quadriceps]|uniref:Uncharacterized protein LOC106751726 n=1 Tax=Dinoponera quadriceps TaxID=609295 RepID=A0A6P3YBA1_DINQU|nr:PREDICTED: uncharacterized protein LOC106751726 [Dinoponera quadriceps]